MNSQKDTIWVKDYQNSCIDEMTSILMSSFYNYSHDYTMNEITYHAKDCNVSLQPLCILHNVLMGGQMLIIKTRTSLYQLSLNLGSTVWWSLIIING